MVNLQPVNSGAALPLSLNSTATGIPAISSQSFMQALSDAISGTLQKFGIDPNSVTLNLGTPAGQKIVASSQVPDTRIGFNALVPLNVSSSPAASASPEPVEHFYAANAADDAYWQAQPPAVQQLREIDDYSHRQALGSQLATQGYQIDVPVMIWGWDAAQTTALRQSFGYTWVPSALQQPVAVAPGLSAMGSLAAYDPNTSPQGSIKV